MGRFARLLAFALLTACGLTVAAAAYLPWGWKMQLIPVATAGLGWQG